MTPFYRFSKIGYALALPFLVSMAWGQQSQSCANHPKEDRAYADKLVPWLVESVNNIPHFADRMEFGTELAKTYPQYRATIYRSIANSATQTSFADLRRSDDQGDTTFADFVSNYKAADPRGAEQFKETMVARLKSEPDGGAYASFFFDFLKPRQLAEITQSGFKNFKESPTNDLDAIEYLVQSVDEISQYIELNDDTPKTTPEQYLAALSQFEDLSKKLQSPGSTKEDADAARALQSRIEDMDESLKRQGYYPDEDTQSCEYGGKDSAAFISHGLVSDVLSTAVQIVDQSPIDSQEAAIVAQKLNSLRSWLSQDQIKSLKVEERQKAAGDADPNPEEQITPQFEEETKRAKACRTPQCTESVLKDVPRFTSNQALDLYTDLFPNASIQQKQKIMELAVGKSVNFSSRGREGHHLEELFNTYLELPCMGLLQGLRIVSLTKDEFLQQRLTLQLVEKFHSAGSRKPQNVDESND